MNWTSPGTNALRHGSCRALVCRCRRASAAVVGGPIPLHATYVMLTTPTVGDDDIPTHATVCHERLPLASTRHSHATVCRQRLPLASPTYYPLMLYTTPFLPPPSWQCPSGNAKLGTQQANKPHRRRPLPSLQGCPLATNLPRIWRPLAPPQGCPLATYKPQL
jgi:hypothetical protein